jgi:hypothetical protein
MSDFTNQELKEFILFKLSELDKKIGVIFTRLKGEIKRVDEKLIGIDKQFGNEEFIARGGIMTAFVRQTLFLID